MTFDEVIDADAETKPYEEETKTATTNFNEKKQPVKHKIYLIIYKSKQKHLLSFHVKIIN